MATLVDTGARAKLNRLFSTLQKRLPEEAIRPTVEAMAIDASKRAPTPDQEFQTMIYGGWSSGGFQVTSSDLGIHRRAARHAAITDTDGRVRFFKPAEMYLKNFIPTSFGVIGLRGWVGSVSGLDSASQYTYVNYRSRGGETFPHEVSRPFWRAWEIGGQFTISPRNFGGSKRYPLQPAPGVKTFQMTKTIPARYMYSSIDPAYWSEKVLKPRIKRVVSTIK